MDSSSWGTSKKTTVHLFWFFGGFTSYVQWSRKVDTCVWERRGFTYASVWQIWHRWWVVRPAIVSAANDALRCYSSNCFFSLDDSMCLPNGIQCLPDSIVVYTLVSFLNQKYCVGMTRRHQNWMFCFLCHCWLFNTTLTKYETFIIYQQVQLIVSVRFSSLLVDERLVLVVKWTSLYASSPYLVC